MIAALLTSKWEPALPGLANTTTTYSDRNLTVQRLGGRFKQTSLTQRHHDTLPTRNLVGQQRLPDGIASLSTSMRFHRQRRRQSLHQLNTCGICLAHHHAATPFAISLLDLRRGKEHRRRATRQRARVDRIFKLIPMGRAHQECAPGVVPEVVV